jgi:hypothetical protein
MFKMKYLINRMQFNFYDNKWGGLMVGVCTSILKVKGSNFTSGVCVVNNGKLIQYSFNLISSLHGVPRLIMWRMYLG